MIFGWVHCNIITISCWMTLKSSPRNTRKVMNNADVRSLHLTLTCFEFDHFQCAHRRRGNMSGLEEEEEENEIKSSPRCSDASILLCKHRHKFPSQSVEWVHIHHVDSMWRQNPTMMNIENSDRALLLTWWWTKVRHDGEDSWRKLGEKETALASICLLTVNSRAEREIDHHLSSERWRGVGVGWFAARWVTAQNKTICNVRSPPFCSSWPIDLRWPLCSSRVAFGTSRIVNETRSFRLGASIMCKWENHRSIQSNRDWSEWMFGFSLFFSQSQCCSHCWSDRWIELSSISI